MSQYAWIEESLSLPRFLPYFKACAGDVDAALHLYWWNLEVSAGFYAPLHCLEIGLRNALHVELAQRFGRPDWWAVCGLPESGTRLVDEAVRSLRPTSGRTPTADDVVAALSFGFWVSLLSRGNEQLLWRPALYRAFRPNYRGPRAALHQHFEHMRHFRNRIMHHEPIYDRHLQADLDRIYELVGFFSPAMVSELRRIDALPAIMARSPRSAAAGP